MKTPQIPKNINIAHFRAAVFGSARIQPNDAMYQQVYNLAKLIAKEGIDIVTGGGPGIMEAANKGHKDGRGKNMTSSFGLNIKLPKEQMANKHLDIKKEFSRFSERLDYFMYLSDVVVVAEGGIGTMLEFLYTWQLVQVEHINNLPIILLGDMWRPFMKWFKKWPLKNKMVNEEDMEPIILARNNDDAIKIIKSAYKKFRSRQSGSNQNEERYPIL